MITSRRVSLNGGPLDQVDERIVIQAIEESAGKDSITAVSRGFGNGQRVTGRRRDYLDVTVRFGILAKYDEMAAREEVLEAANTWAAKGGYLTVDHKPDRRIRKAELVSAPGAGNIRNWTADFSMVLRAYGIPYWEAKTPATWIGAAAGSGGTGTYLEVPGNTETEADMLIENMSGQRVEYVNIRAGSSVMSFSDLALAAGEALAIDHDDDGILRIRIRNAAKTGYRSAMLSRSPGSADDLTVKPGNIYFSMSAQRACRPTVTVRGRWL